MEVLVLTDNKGMSHPKNTVIDVYRDGKCAESRDIFHIIRLPELNYNDHVYITEPVRRGSKMTRSRSYRVNKPKSVKTADQFLKRLRRIRWYNGLFRRMIWPLTH
jgi:hypothetical protein